MKKIADPELLRHIQRFKKVKGFLDSAFYAGHSLVTYDLVLTLLEAHYEGKKLSIKQICGESNRSILNTRKHLNNLIAQGWVELSNGDHDKRQRVLVCTAKLNSLMTKIHNHFE